MKYKPVKMTKSRIARDVNCYYCEKKEEPYYKNTEDIGRYVNDRARIVGRDRSGLCAKHQRKLATAIKQARHLGLIPFTISI